MQVFITYAILETSTFTSFAAATTSWLSPKSMACLRAWIVKGSAASCRRAGGAGALTDHE